MAHLIGDLRFAVRQLLRNPGFTVTAVLTIALAIGTATATFSIVNAALLKSLPFREPERLEFIWGTHGPEHEIRGASFLEVQDWREQSRTFADISVYNETSLNLSDQDRTVAHVEAEIVSANYFRLLGIGAAAGRTFTPEDDRIPDKHPVAVISHDLWANRLGHDTALVGGTLTLNDRVYTVVGVMPPGFRGLSFDTEVWIPAMMVSAIRPVDVLTNRGERWLGAVGRLKPGASRASAQADLDRIAARLGDAYPKFNTDRGARLTSLSEYHLGTTKSLLMVLFGAVIFLTLIACVNVANLQLVRAAGRHREIAIRSALGAGRRRVLRQLLTEGMVLALLGAAGGVVLAFWGMKALIPLVPAGVLPGYVAVALDGTVLGFSLLLGGICGVVFGLVPALKSSRPDLSQALKTWAPSSSRASGKGGRVSAQQILVVCQVALALVLLIGAGLMIRSFRERLSVDPGFLPDGLISARVALPESKYRPEDQVRFSEELVERLRALPAVQSAAVGSDLPLRGNSSAGILLVEDGDREGIRYYRHRVTPEYFSTLHIPLLIGRPFTRHDREDQPRVAIASEAMARRLWPGADPVGKRISLSGPSGPWVTVIGVTANAKYRDLTADPMDPAMGPDLYLPFAQSPDPDAEVVVRSSRDPVALTAVIQREVAAIDPGLPIFRAEPMTATLAQQTANDRFGAFLLALFSGMALVLAAIGIYGVLAFVVRGSRRDIAIRMAIGANQDEVVGLVVRQGMIMAFVGVALGLTFALLATRALSALLFGVTATDPVTFGAISLLIGFVMLLASYLPARTAARVDPITVLRSD